MTNRIDPNHATQLMDIAIKMAEAMDPHGTATDCAETAALTLEAAAETLRTLAFLAPPTGEGDDDASLAARELALSIAHQNISIDQIY